jgi:uncharacterized metal-binding protein YceD (DUF177 family)
VAAAAEGLSGTGATVEGALEVRRVGRDLHVTGRLSGGARVACDRCGAEAALAVEAVLDCLYAAPRGEDQALPEEAYADIGEFDGEALDLAHVVAESFALERPARVRCGDVDPAADVDCHARWRAAAGDPAFVPDPRLSALAGFKPPH